MRVTGIICEYNPFHLGHQKQFSVIRRTLGPEQGIVCLMSGNFVQRGAPAVFDKSVRAEAAICSGADLVLELPVQVSLSSAEGFAAGGVGILFGFCDSLCFGTESASRDSLVRIAEILLSDAFPERLREKLGTGLSFPAARQAALVDMGLDGDILVKPNDILAVEYCKAILAQGSAMEPMPIHRDGDYHGMTPDPENPSATFLRSRICSGEAWQAYVPRQAVSLFENAPRHTVAAGERAVLARLRTMDDGEFESLPFGSEGLWRKLMHACRKEPDLESILQAVKSKRYTRSRLDRMVMCAFLGITGEELGRKAPYVRVLALNDRGREILKKARGTGCFLNAGEAAQEPDWQAECRRGDLYGLFAVGAPEAPGAEARRRIVYHKE